MDTRQETDRNSAEARQKAQRARTREAQTVITGKGRDFALKAHAPSHADPRTQQKKQRMITGLFVSRLAPPTRATDVMKHIRAEFGFDCKCEALVTKYDSYRSFCIRCPAHVRQTLLNPNGWPLGTLVKEY